MIDALNLGGPANLELIHLDEPRERAYWAHVLSISEDELRKIVDRVGPRAIDVRRHLMRARRAEWQRRAHQPPQHVHRDLQASGSDSPFAVIVCCAAAVATLLGALAYGLPPPDEWTAFQHQHGCEAAVNTDATIKQLRCADGHTIVRGKVAGAAGGTAPKPMR
jgi:hypothetical protein